MPNNNPCASTALYESLVHCKGATVLPGLRPHIFYIPKRDIVTFPTPPNTVPSGGTMGDLATISEDFVLAADAKFKRIDIVSNASNVNSESQGEAPSKTFNNTGVFKYPATMPKQPHSAVRRMPMTSCICGHNVMASTACWATRCLKPTLHLPRRAVVQKPMQAVQPSMWL